MRGKVAVDVDYAAADRITPAHAGKSCMLPVVLATKKDHPRPCGEKPERAANAHIFAGSPPPMRGKGATT